MVAEDRSFSVGVSDTALDGVSWTRWCKSISSIAKLSDGTQWQEAPITLKIFMSLALPTEIQCVSIVPIGDAEGSPHGMSAVEMDIKRWKHDNTRGLLQLRRWVKETPSVVKLARSVGPFFPLALPFLQASPVYWLFGDYLSSTRYPSLYRRLSASSALQSSTVYTYYSGIIGLCSSFESRSYMLLQVGLVPREVINLSWHDHGGNCICVGKFRYHQHT